MSREIAMIGAVLVTGVVLAVQQASTPDAVPLLNTPAWQGAAPKYGDQLLLRRDPESGNSLLLKHSGHDGAYRYDARARTLAAVAEPVWLRAKGSIAECGTQIPPAPQVLTIDPKSHRLIAGTREVPTAGRTVLALTESPGHRFAAVLSADGPAPKSLLPPLGSGVPAGQRFHQVVSLPDVRAIGNPIRIPVRRPEDVLAVCWTVEENAIVYHDILFAHLSVVEITP
jgi:hypothetical protein